MHVAPLDEVERRWPCGQGAESAGERADLVIATGGDGELWSLEVDGRRGLCERRERFAQAARKPRGECQRRGYDQDHGGDEPLVDVALQKSELRDGRREDQPGGR